MDNKRPLSIVIAGGGTAGHVSPMLAVAEELRSRNPESKILAIGTEEGLEKQMVPAAGFELRFIPRVPFPRRPDAYTLKFPKLFYKAIKSVKEILLEVKADVVFGVGGYVSTPAYIAAQQLKIPYVIHEANTVPGLANKLGTKKAAAVGTAFADAGLPKGVRVGMPMKKEISSLDRIAKQKTARERLGLEPDIKTLIVTGGSSGAKSVNEALVKTLQNFEDNDIQVLHIVGPGKAIEVSGKFPHYHQVEFISQMQDVYAAADILVCRSGSGTVSEVCAVGVPAVFIPLPFGNGEQRLNAQPVVDAGGGVMVDNHEFNDKFISEELIPLLNNEAAQQKLAANAYKMGIRDADVQVAEMIEQVTNA
ncbi:MAG: undecaprenyldiphospho-muramoylpentapeptide beta-N-acetylglucosaminyltransferase [Micrococcaceae bacterium]